MNSLGFENYAEALKIYLTKYREVWLRSSSPPRNHPQVTLTDRSSSPPRHHPRVTLADLALIRHRLKEQTTVNSR